MTSGREVLLEVLASEGVRHCFGNPGTTELPFIDELAVHPELRYVLALQENVAVAMADGYAQASGRPSFVNLHTAAGLGGGMGNLTNAWFGRTPMVVTAGQQDRRHLLAEPLLSGDLVGMARACTKWQYEVHHLADLGPVLRRAFLDAANPPAGPVFVSIPMDLLDETGDVTTPARSQVHRGAVAAGLDELATLLAEAAPDRLAIVVGDDVAASGALSEAVAVAEALGARVYSSALYSKLNFPTTHPLYGGMLPITAAAMAGTLSAFDRVFVVGTKALPVYPWSPGPPVPPHVELLHLSANAAELGRDLPTRFGTVGEVRASLAALAPILANQADATAARTALEAARAEREGNAARLEAAIAQRAGDVPMAPLVAIDALLSALSPGAVVVDEAITGGLQVRAMFQSDTPGSYYFGAAGGLGWGIGAALGVKLARPEAPVLCIVGDGSAMYASQALWTAAHERIPVVVTVVNNRQYAILKNNLAGSGGRSAQTGTFVAMDLDEPPIDYVGLARSMGVDAALVEKPADVTEAVREAFDSARPTLLELPIAPP